MNSRLIAAKILCRIFRDGISLTSALDETVPGISSAKDRAFVQAICYGVMRWYYRLDFILNQLLHKPIKDLDVKLLALIGLYQIKYMRVKPHAAVSETVSAVRRKPWAKSLLNAVLRTYLREQEMLEGQADENKGVATSHPDWLVKLISNNWPEQAGQILDENNMLPPMVLRINTNRCSNEEYLKKLNDIDVDARMSDICPSAVFLGSPMAVDSLPGFLRGDVFVQDSAAQLAAGLLDVQPGQRVLDVCAAPGGKTTHIMELQPNLDSLTAVDIDKNRLQMVDENLQRLGQQALLVEGDASQPGLWWDGVLYDRILLDAPCSATGVIRRNPDIKFLRIEEDISQLQTLQKNILNAAWRMLTSGGLLLYATCSILKEENEYQIRSFLNSYNDAVEVHIDAEWGIKRDYGRQILTGDNGMDGFYYALIQKK